MKLTHYKLIPAPAVILGMTIMASHGVTFDYSYVFPSGLKVSGELDGDVNGDYVENVTNVTLSFNGTQITDPISAWAYSPPGGGAGWTPGPIVSFDVFKNNFGFADFNLATQTGYDSVFFIVNDPAVQYLGLADSVELSVVTESQQPVEQSRWSLTRRPNSVPDGGSTIGILGMGLTGIFGLRRKIGI